MLILPFQFHRNTYYILGFALFIILTALLLPQYIPASKQDTVATGLLADMIVTFPVAYYFLIVRKFGQKAWRIMFVVSCCCATAYLTLPAHQQHYILQLRKFTVMAELGLVVYAISRIRKISSCYRCLQDKMPDTAYNIKWSLTSILGDITAVRVFASEITILRFGLLCWRRVRPWPANAVKFTVYKESGYVALISVLMFVCLIELTGVHLLVAQYSHIAGYIVSALSAYGLIFLIADLSAILKSPVIIYQNNLLLRVGLRWQTHTTVDNILSVTKLQSNFILPDGCFKGTVLKNTANVLITFNNPVMINRLYRQRTTVHQIAITVDGANKFISAIKNG